MTKPLAPVSRHPHLRLMAVLVLAVPWLVACGPLRQPVRYPEGTLQVRYESAPDHSTCLVACVAMAANYLVGYHKYDVEAIRSTLKDTGRDETLVGDLKGYLQDQGLYLVCLRQGQADGKPPTGLKYWLKNRGYPVICVINRDTNGDPGFNHAVLVIGISGNPDDPSTDIVHYFDPSTNKPIWWEPVPVFEVLWDRCDRTMMLVVAPSKDAPSGNDGPH